MSGMKQILILTLSCWMSGMLMAQNVTNVVAKQVGNTVEITYDLDQYAQVSLLFSVDGGTTYAATPKTLTGDVGWNVAPGHRKIVWNLLADETDWDIQRARFKVLAENLSKMTFTINGVSFTMILVEGGTFTMGCTSEQGGDCDDDEKPKHSVTLSDYYIGRTEVTQVLWVAVMGTNPSFFKGDNLPIEQVSWNDCQNFIAKLNELLTTQLKGKRFALPTEAQWEYAARGGKKSRGYKYSGGDNIEAVAWYEGNSSRRTHFVGLKASNELGLYDMSGNVWEWCKEWLDKYSFEAQVNPAGDSFGSLHAYRGGCWCFCARRCRITDRAGSSSSYAHNALGLRLVLQ